MAAAVIGCAALGACSSPPAASARDAEPTETSTRAVMAYNVKHPSEASVALIGDVIANADSQVVALQESSPAETRDIARASGLSAYPAPMGLGIVAAEPVEDSLFLDLEGGGGLFAVRLDGGLWFATVHLSPSQHEEQAHELAGRISEEFRQRPLVLAGDLNGLPADVRPLLDHFEERARWTVDYILVRGGHLGAWTAITSYASDHFPLVADVEIDLPLGARAR